MSSITSIPSPSVEEYNPSINRTITTPLDFSHQREELYLDEVFFQTKVVNQKLGYIHENISDLVSFTSIYNSVYPLDTYEFSEYDIEGFTAKGVALSENCELIFDQNVVHIFRDRVLYTTISSTEYGELQNINDVKIINGVLYILDGNFLLLLDISSPEASLITFFGGLGSNETQYNFISPIKIIHDSSLNEYGILQRNGFLKKYSLDFNTFIGGRETTNLIDSDVEDGEYYELFSDRITITNIDKTLITIQHNIVEPLSITIDRGQNGFFYVRGKTSIYKFTVGGLFLGGYNNTSSVSDFDKCGTTTVAINDGSLVFGLDHTFSTSLLSTQTTPTFELNQIEVNCDELASSMVINDSINKLYQNLIDFNNDVLTGFVSNFNDDSTLSDVVIEDLQPEELDIDCNGYLGLNEVVNCSSWNRCMDQMYDVLITARNRLFGTENFFDQETFDVLSDNLLEGFFDPTVNGQNAEGLVPQLFNPSRTPLSLVEICGNPSLSSIEFI